MICPLKRLNAIGQTADTQFSVRRWTWQSPPSGSRSIFVRSRKRWSRLPWKSLVNGMTRFFCQSMIFRMVGIGVCVKTDTSFLQVDTDLWQKRDKTGCFTARSRRRGRNDKLQVHNKEWQMWVERQLCLSARMLWRGYVQMPRTYDERAKNPFHVRRGTGETIMLHRMENDRTKRVP